MATLAAVGAIHVVIGLGVVAGLAVNGVIQIDPGRTKIIDFPSPLPSPPPPDPTQNEQKIPETPRAVPTPDIVLTPLPPVPADPDPITPVYGSTGAGDTGTTVLPTPTPIPPPMPTPTASFTPTRPTPANNAARWISNDDYPASEIRREIEGTVQYRLVIGSNGQINTCEITSSSGSKGLDDTTCRLLNRRARFNAATDNTGARVVGTYTGSVRWELPD